MILFRKFTRERDEDKKVGTELIKTEYDWIYKRKKDKQHSELFAILWQKSKTISHFMVILKKKIMFILKIILNL